MQAGEFRQANTILRETQRFQAAENEKDRWLSEAQLALQERGITLDENNVEYSRILAEVEAGRVAPETLTNFLSSQLEGAGVTLLPPDPNAAINAIDEEYNLSLAQWSKTHPEFILDFNTGDGKKLLESAWSF